MGIEDPDHPIFKQKSNSAFVLLHDRIWHNQMEKLDNKKHYWLSAYNIYEQ